MTKTLLQLIRLRRSRMTQAELARKMDISRQQASNIESDRQGNPSILTIEKYAKAVGARLVVEDKS